MYIELHAASAFSFLEGASIPEELVDVCAEVQMPAMGLLDRDGGCAWTLEDHPRAVAHVPQPFAQERPPPG